MNIKTAHTLALASKAVYLEEYECKNQAADWGFDCTWIEASDTQCCVMSNEDRCILAFRGTNSVKDWLTDLDVFKSPAVYGEAHHGFQEALDYVWDEVKSVVEQNTHPGFPNLHVTGHSLGAALATLAVSRLDYGQLYTFGSPRVGDSVFAQQFDQQHRSYRFVNNNDVVARVPMRGYKHVSSLRYFTQAGKMWAEPHKWWLTYDRLWGRVKRVVADGIKDHNIGDYASLVGRQM